MLIEAMNNGDHPAMQVRNLSIKNVQDVVDKDVNLSADLKTVLSRVDALSLYMATGEDDYSPCTIEFKEAQEFFGGQLNEFWLQSVQNHLAHLKFYADT